jgi:hypothetical protein
MKFLKNLISKNLHFSKLRITFTGDFFAKKSKKTVLLFLAKKSRLIFNDTDMGKKNTNDDNNSEGNESAENLQEKNAVKEMSDNLKDARDRLKSLQEKSKALRDKLKK